MSNPEIFSFPAGTLGGVAIIADEGSYTFDDLASDARRVAATLLGNKADLGETRVAFLTPPGYRFTALMLGVWAAGGIAVPLATSHPAPELRHVVEDSNASVIVASGEFKEVLAGTAAARRVEILDADDVVFGSAPSGPLPRVDAARRALIVYTSGSTGKPKGVVWTHRMIDAQIQILSMAWQWTADDRSLLVLPLHHVHGLFNVLCCSIWNGATCEILPSFDAPTTLGHLAGDTEVTVFMAVPTIYRRLIAAWESLDPEGREEVAAGLSGVRLMVSGSAALPVATLDSWREISGHTLLERYGMTEIGMALSNPYDGARIPGAVGTPFPGVEIRLVDDEGRRPSPGDPGEIYVKGPTVFSEYWRLPDESDAAFVDGWFRTGDIAVTNEGVYRILGRQSVDIIKSGAEKISVLEIEDVLRLHPAIADCAVVGIPDDDWGERVAVAVVGEGDLMVDLGQLRAFAAKSLARYKLPRQLLILDDLPRNALGKVVKPRLKELFSRDFEAPPNP